MKNTINQRQLAIISGISIIVMTMVAALIMGGVYAEVFKMDLEQFKQQSLALKTPLILGAWGWIAILICDLVVSWSLYRYFLKKNQKKSMIMGALRLLYSFILMVGIVQLVRAVFINQPQDVYQLLHQFQTIWQMGLIVFGVHLIYLANLFCKKRTIQQVISILLFVAGIGYMISNIADLLIDDYETIRSKVEAVFILPMILGEFGLAIWMLAKGGKEVTFLEKQCVSEFC